jgi:alpha/beta superfamily hydrolase
MNTMTNSQHDQRKNRAANDRKEVHPLRAQGGQVRADVDDVQELVDRCKTAVSGAPPSQPAIARSE